MLKRSLAFRVPDVRFRRALADDASAPLRRSACRRRSGSSPRRCSKNPVPREPKTVEMEGTLEVLVEDWHDRSRMRHFLESDSGERYALRFAPRSRSCVTGAG